MFKGSLVALITPMRADGSIDEKAYAELVDWQIAEGTQRGGSGRHHRRIARPSATTSTSGWSRSPSRWRRDACR